MKRPFRLRPQKPPKLVENDIERQCLDGLLYLRYRPERLHAGRFKSLDGARFITGHAKGTPDYVVTHELYPAFYLEVKRPGESPEPEQEKKHLELSLYGLAVTWVDSYDALLVWLDVHQRNARALWREALEKSHT